MPNSTFIGERTYGATGPITLYEIYNDGSFSVGDFLTVQTSSATVKNLDGQILENRGFDPDINVKFDAVSVRSGVGTQLEKTIPQLKK